MKTKKHSRRRARKEASLERDGRGKRTERGGERKKKKKKKKRKKRRRRKKKKKTGVWRAFVVRDVLLAGTLFHVAPSPRASLVSSPFFSDFLCGG